MLSRGFLVMASPLCLCVPQAFFFIASFFFFLPTLFCCLAFFCRDVEVFSRAPIWEGDNLHYYPQYAFSGGFKFPQMSSRSPSSNRWHVPRTPPPSLISSFSLPFKFDFWPLSPILGFSQAGLVNHPQPEISPLPSFFAFFLLPGDVAVDDSHENWKSRPTAFSPSRSSKKNFFFL